MKHYELQHSSNGKFSAICGVDNCPKSYHNVRALCAHLRSKHAVFYGKHMVTPRSVTSSGFTHAYEAEENNYSTSSSTVPAIQGDIVSDVSNTAQACAKESLLNNVAAWSLKLREINKIPGGACEEMRHRVLTELSASREALMVDVQKKMQELGTSPSISNAVVHIMSQPTEHEIAYQTLESEYNVNKYVETNFAYVEPVQYKLENLDRSDDKIEYMQYVPLLESLKMLLQNNDIFSAVLNSHQSKDNKLRDFCDGSHFRQHPLFSIDNQALQIILYYDDFGAVNPLGHRAKTYKIGAFYFMIANLSPKDRSRLHTIHLTALCFSSAVKRCGFDEVLKPLINDLITLSNEGVTVNRLDGTFNFKGALCVVVADNLAAHAIGGFFESFSSTHPCRFCVIRKDKMQDDFVCCSSILRTAETYSNQLSLIAQDKSFQSVYGIKKNSCLNILPYYHVISGLPSDAMHDLLEGVVCDVVECIIKYCILEGFITLEFLNYQIENFSYTGSYKTNKPDALTDPSKCRQTAAKNRCLLQLLPAMIGFKVPSGDRKWQVLLCLLEVHDLAFSPTMSEAHTFLLDDAVELFLVGFHTEFPDERVKPKMHFLVHYGMQCRMFGPLIQYWSFRFEGKHGYFKEIASRLKCRRNILLTLARKHQYYHSWHLQQTSSYLHDALLSNCSGKLVELNSLPVVFRSILKPLIVAGEMVFQANSAEIDGVKYGIGQAVITGVDNCEMHFCIVRGLYIIDSKVFIIGSRLENQMFMKHFHYYTGVFSSSVSLFSVADLLDPFPLMVLLSSDGTSCIVLRHSIASLSDSVA